MFVLVKITAAEVDRRRFTTVSTFAGAANFERTDISNRPNFAHEQCQSVHPRGCGVPVAPPGGLGSSLRAPSACRVVICELMSSERVLWLFVPHLSWSGRGRCMDMPMHMRTFRDPASSFSAKFSVARARRIVFPGTERPKLINEVPKDQAAFARKCAHGKEQKCGVSAHTSRSPVYMTVATWCLPMSMVTHGRKCIDSIRPSVLVKLSCRLCRVVFPCSVQCLRCSVRAHDLLQAAWIGCSHSVAPTCSSLFHIDCRARAQKTRFSPNITVEARGAVPNMLDLRRRSSFPILFRCGMIQLATAQNCFVKCVVVRVRDDVCPTADTVRWELLTHTRSPSSARQVST